MRKLFLCMFIAMVSFGLMVNEASAKRFGGGRSFGVQRSNSSLFSPAATKSFKSNNLQSSGRKWGGMLGGLLIGGLLASLFMSNGFGAGLLSWLAIAAVAFFIIHYLRKRTQPAFQSQSPMPFSMNTDKEPVKPWAQANAYSQSSEAFDTEAFLREAQVIFYRLQRAYDAKNLDDIREFTTPEVFGEIKMQLNERGDGMNKTEVLNLEASLLNSEKQTRSLMASVSFSGFVKENEGPMEPFKEIWHFSQYDNNKSWFVSGIQQAVL